MKLKLNTFSNSKITQGALFLDDEFICFTVEPIWKNNKKNISCIPAGVYKISRVESPKFGNTFGVIDVADRTNILFHKGNTTLNTMGCIMPCQYFGILGGIIAGLSSKTAYDQLMKMLGNDEHTLEIKRQGI